MGIANITRAFDSIASYIYHTQPSDSLACLDIQAHMQKFKIGPTSPRGFSVLHGQTTAWFGVLCMVLSITSLYLRVLNAPTYVDQVILENVRVYQTFKHDSQILENSYVTVQTLLKWPKKLDLSQNNSSLMCGY